MWCHFPFTFSADFSGAAFHWHLHWQSGTEAVCHMLWHHSWASSCDWDGSEPCPRDADHMAQLQHWGASLQALPGTFPPPSLNDLYFIFCLTYPFSAFQCISQILNRVTFQSSTFDIAVYAALPGEHWNCFPVPLCSECCWTVQYNHVMFLLRNGDCGSLSDSHSCGWDLDPTPTQILWEIVREWIHAFHHVTFLTQTLHF